MSTLIKTQGSVNEQLVTNHVSLYGSTLVNQIADFDTRNTISYEGGARFNPDGKSIWKYCVHRSHLGPERWNLRWRSLYTSPVYQDRRCVTYFPDGAQQTIKTLNSVVERVKPLTDAELLHEAEHKFAQVAFRTYMPITDLVQLSRKVDGLGPIDALFTSLLAPFRGVKTLAQLIKASAGADLAWKFAVKPTIASILDCLQAGKRVDEQLKKLAKRDQSMQDNFVVTVNRSTPEHLVSSDSWLAGNGSSSYCVKGDVYERVDDLTKIHFRCRTNGSTSDGRRTRLLWDSLGLTNLFTTAWDLVPLSFVVDWFVNVSRFLSQLDNYYFHAQPLEKLTEINDVWVTEFVKASRIYKNARGVSDSGLTNTVYAGQGDYTLSAQYFRRRPINPTTARLWLPSLQVGGRGITLAQMTTGLELLVQRTF